MSSFKRNDCNEFKLNSTLMKIIAIWLCLYATLSNPFLISSYVPLFLRTILEGGLLYLLVIYFLFSKTLRFTVVAISIWLMIFLLTLIGVDGYVNSLISTVFKFAILIMVVPLSKESTLFVNVIRKYWIFIWSLASISVLLIFFNTTFKIFNIEQFFFSEVNELAPYVYEGNFLGFFTPYYFFDFIVPKINWYLYEPVYLSFFLGLNIIAADIIVEKKHNATIFRVINIIAGVFTFSTTFMFFLFAYLFFLFANLSIFKRYLILTNMLTFFFMILVLLWFFNEGDTASFTSAADRVNRSSIAAQVFFENSFFAHLLGNGILYVPITADRGISSGIEALYVERGILTSTFIYYVLYKMLIPNWILMIFLIYYSMAFQIIWLPLLYLFIVIVVNKHHLIKIR